MIKTKHFISGDKLIRYNDKTDKYYQENKLGDKLIEKPDNLIPLKKEEFNRLLNLWYANLEHKWEYQGVKFKKGECLDNDEILRQLPRHQINKWTNGYMCYCKGKICFMSIEDAGTYLYDSQKKGRGYSNLKTMYGIINLETNKYI